MSLKPCPPPRKWERLLPHPIALKFPEISAELLQEILGSMQKRGYDPTFPIVLFEGMILDGRNRHRQALMANGAPLREHPPIVPTFAEFRGTRDEAIDFAITANLFRRHLTAGQRALIGDELATMRLGCNQHVRVNQTNAEPEGGSADLPTLLSQQEAASVVKVSPRTIRNARMVRRADPNIADQVRNGKISLEAAVRKVRSKDEAVENAPQRRPVVDAAGRPIPVRAKRALTDGAERFRRARLDLQRIGRELRALADEPDGRLLAMDVIETDLKNVTRAIRFAAPHTSCPLGSDDEPCAESCGLCKGTHWLGENEWKSVPQRLRERSA